MMLLQASPERINDLKRLELIKNSEVDLFFGRKKEFQ